MRLFTIFSLLLLPLCSSAAAPLYRYIDADGHRVMSNNLPTEVAQQGYDILDGSSMRLISHVDRALTLEEKADKKRLDDQKKRNEERTILQKKEQEIARLAEIKRAHLAMLYDEQLLIRYSSLDDLEQQREDAVSSSQARIERARNRLLSLKETVSNLEEQIATNEREQAEQSEIDELISRVTKTKKDAFLLIRQLRESEDNLKKQQTSFDKDKARLSELREHINK